VLPWITKSPDETLDYNVDWSEWLGTDTIDSVAWTVPTDLTEEAESSTDTVATIWLSGGTTPDDDIVTCQITTAAGRVASRSFQVRMQAAT
jgi:hypothetical protein